LKLGSVVDWLKGGTVANAGVTNAGVASAGSFAALRFDFFAIAIYGYVELQVHLNS
jgi:hypothetical protein